MTKQTCQCRILKDRLDQMEQDTPNNEHHDI